MRIDPQTDSCCDHLHYCGADGRHFHQCCGHWHGRAIEPQIDSPPPADLTYDAWVLLANGAYWDHTDPKRAAEWDAARTRWRDRWHETIGVNTDARD